MSTTNFSLNPRLRMHSWASRASGIWFRLHREGLDADVKAAGESGARNGSAKCETCLGVLAGAIT